MKIDISVLTYANEAIHKADSLLEYEKMSYGQVKSSRSKVLAKRKKELIPRVCARAVGIKLMPAAVLRPQIKDTLAIQLDLDLVMRRSPEP